ncbi:MAG TPA: ASCH domain-containing protein [Candidatus Paceibacterota bacterium]|nr:ASCH domain-containing protein [Candidatus Paceibacterota bacterium]
MPKIWTLRFRASDRNDFDNIKNGIKSVETRAATERYRAIKKGDLLRIVCGNARIEKKVKRVRRFASIEAMLRAIPRITIMPETVSVAEMRKAYYGYPGYKEKIKKFGIIAMEV